jgi:hypothetical protein
MATHLESSWKRTLPNDLEVTHRVGYSDYGTYGGFTESERTEPFVVRFKRSGRVNGYKGQVAFVWRINYVASDYSSPKAGDVTIHGYTDTGSTIGFNSDAEAAEYVETVRVDGKPMKAKDHPSHERAAERYAQNMSY